MLPYCLIVKAKHVFAYFDNQSNPVIPSNPSVPFGKSPGRCIRFLSWEPRHFLLPRATSRVHDQELLGFCGKWGKAMGKLDTFKRKACWILGFINFDVKKELQMATLCLIRNLVAGEGC